ncbi:MAG: SsrA-binding protein SmpB [Patescibacteria group bacterium]
MNTLSENKRARFDYEVLDTYEAGIELKGFEVKSVKNGRMNLAGTFVVPKGNELYLLNADISPYQANNTPKDYDSKRSRRILLKHAEIKELIGKITSTSLTLVPLRVYNKGRLVKVEIALVKPKKKYDKRETTKKREAKRMIGRTLKREQ